MSHRKAGIKRIQNQTNQKQNFQKKAQEISVASVQEMHEQLGIFKQNLQQFAAKHAQELRQNTIFRSRFQTLCLKIGIDPLQSQKSFWSTLGFGDFYYELCIQLVQMCIQTRSTNGGLLEFNQAKTMLSKLRVNQPEISDVDIEAALKCLKPLGDGYRIVTIGHTRMIQSIPDELNKDHLEILGLAEDTGAVTRDAICSQLGWSLERAQDSLDKLLKQGICWIDIDRNNSASYYIISYFKI